MTSQLRRLVRDRAKDRCEYCTLPQRATPMASFHVEHVRPLQHGGSDDDTNLAFACDRCNLFKGPNLSAVDPDTGAVVRMFNPRSDVWTDHFEANGALIGGKTDIGRATMRLLNMNAPRRVALRAEVQLDKDA